MADAGHPQKNYMGGDKFFQAVVVNVFDELTGKYVTGMLLIFLPRTVVSS